MSGNDPRTNGTWLFAGLTTSFPDIQSSISSEVSRKHKLSDLRSCSQDDLKTAQGPSCKILQIPGSGSIPIELSHDDALQSVALQEQVLVFQYRGRYHAVDHSCPHRSYPLSRGTIHDIEDFGIVLSAGITCPKHGWSFDLHTGESDRGMYKLGVWEVEVREPRKETDDGNENGTLPAQVREVWVRRKLRNG